MDLKATTIKALLTEQPLGTEVCVKGWVRTFRNNQFIALSDGSTIKTIQVVVDYESMDPSILKK